MKNGQKIKRELIWFKGEIVPLEYAKINILTTTAQYGINVFEGVRCYYNSEKGILYAFRLFEHLERLFNSAKMMRFNLNRDINIEYIKSNFSKVILASNFKEDIYVKIGLFLDGCGSWSHSDPIGLFIFPMPKGRVFGDTPRVSCCISSWERINDRVIPPRIKAGANYLNSRFALIEAYNNGYDYTIFLNRNGYVAEGPGACIFIVKNGTLITPSLTASILESITRDTIIEIAKNEFAIEVVEREIDRTELYLADEIFFVGTTVEILPVIAVDKIPINVNDIGPVTKKIKEKFFEITRNNLFKYSRWLTPITND